MKDLSDNFGRPHSYLRLSVTERCNLGCLYCAPGSKSCRDSGEKRETSLDEIITLAGIFARLGINKIRLTGGEPLVRDDLEKIASGISALDGIDKIGVTTNGVFLSKRTESLKESGIKLVNVSLDTLQTEKYRSITGSDLLANSLDGLNRALEAGFESVKVNVVVIRGINDDEICDFVEFACHKKLNLRFIEFMPFRGNRWSEDGFIPADEMRARIAEKFELAEIPQTYNKVKEYAVSGQSGVKIGFIASISNSFCDWCNRLRLTADGRLINCLFSAENAVDLLTPLRDGRESEYIAGLIRQAVKAKPKSHASAETLLKEGYAPMIGIGG